MLLTEQLTRLAPRYVFGGRTTGYNAHGPGIATVQVYNIAENKWSFGPEMLFGE